MRRRTDVEVDAFVKTLGGYARLLPLVFAGLCAIVEAREPQTVVFDLGSPYTLHVTPDGATFEQSASKRCDATISMTPQDFLRFVTSDLHIDTAFASGRITIKGDQAALGRLFERDTR